MLLFFVLPTSIVVSIWSTRRDVAVDVAVDIVDDVVVDEFDLVGPFAFFNSGELRMGFLTVNFYIRIPLDGDRRFE